MRSAPEASFMKGNAMSLDDRADGLDPALRAQVEGLFGEYVRALDDRRFDDWLALFSEQAFYGVIRHADHLSGNHLFILGESKDKLRNRIEMGMELDKAMQIHLLTGIRTHEESGGRILASANFAVLRGSLVGYSGQYQLELSREAGRPPKITRCCAIVANDRPTELLYLPI
jgi:3-phenylpropionate/cinnamic acid dioxygenase small subunit